MGKFSLELDEACVGELLVVEGEGFDVEPWIRRREGTARVYPRPGFWDWVDGSLYGERRQGALVAFDAEGRESERLIVVGATILELGTPRIERSAECSGALTLRVRVGATELAGGGPATQEGLAGAERIGAARLVIAGEPPAIYEIAALAPLTVKVAPGERPAAATQRVVVTLAGVEGASLDVSGWVGRPAQLEYLDSEMNRVIAELACILAGAVVVDGLCVELACKGLGVVTKP